MQHIPINKESLPVQFDISYGGDTFTMRFDYNLTYDYFTVHLYKIESEGPVPVILGEVLVINKPLWNDFVPDITIGPTFIPVDLSNIQERITWDNFEKTVFLYVDDDSVSIDEVSNGGLQ